MLNGFTSLNIEKIYFSLLKGIMGEMIKAARLRYVTQDPEYASFTIL